MKSKNLILMVGLPVSGKSTIAKYINSRNKYEIVSPEKFIKDIAVEENKTFTQTYGSYFDEAMHHVDSLVNHNIREKKNVIIDMRNMTFQDRKYYITPFRNAKYRIYGVYLDSSEEGIVTRNNIREQKGMKIDDAILKQMFKNFQAPKYTEFDDFITIKDGMIGDEEKIRLDSLRNPW